MKTLSVALALIAPAQAGLRFPCSTLTVQRLDPVVQPGAIPAAHVHHIVGGNAFNATMEGDVGERATCTTCQMAEDFSNYWTAQLYFKHPNGSYHRVPVIPVQPLLGGSQGAKAGLTVYYTQFDLNKDNLGTQKITAFKPVPRCPPPLPVSSSSNTRVAGLPDDRRQSDRDRQAARRPPLSVPARPEPRSGDGQLPHGPLLGWHFHHPPLSRVSPLLPLPRLSSFPNAFH